MTNDDLAIPAFLRRTERSASLSETVTATPILPPSAGRRLTAAAKDRIASDILAAVDGGAETFGQIRKALGAHYSDRDLRAGIRAAKHWQPRLKPGTMAGRPVMRRERVALMQSGRRYNIIKA